MDNSKKQLKIKREFKYLHDKVEQMEEERETDRSWESQKVIKDHKKMKLKLKDKLYKGNAVPITKDDAERGSW